MKIIYTFWQAWAALPVITAFGNEIGRAGNFHVTEAWCILRLWVDCSSDEHFVESFATPVTTTHSWQGLLVSTVIDAFWINAIRWWHLPPGCRYERAAFCCVRGANRMKARNAIKSEAWSQAAEKHLKCSLSSGLQRIRSKTRNVFKNILHTWWVIHGYTFIKCTSLMWTCTIWKIWGIHNNKNKKVIWGSMALLYTYKY